VNFSGNPMNKTVIFSKCNKLPWLGKFNVALLLLLAAVNINAPLAPRSAWADDFHYNDVIIGDRPGGMGGAYTAISDDASGLFYNPAGIVLVEGGKISASVTTFRSENKIYQGELGSFDYPLSSTTLQPNFFGIVNHTPFGAIGFSYVIRDSLYQYSNNSFLLPNSDIFTLNLIDDVNTYNIGPTIAFDVSKDFKVGITMYYFYKTERYSYNTVKSTPVNPNNAVVSQWDNDYYKDEENGTRPVLGFLYAPEGETYSLGLVLSKTFIFNANQYDQITCSLTVATPSDYCYSNLNPGHQPLLTTPVTRSNILPDYPLEVRFGAAYFPNKDFLVAADLDYFDAASPDNIVYTWIRKPVINAAIGIEYFLNPGLALRAGLFTDRTNVSAEAIANINGWPADRVDRYGATMSTTWFSKFSSITIGANYAIGSGDSNLLWYGSVLPLKTSVLTIFLGTAYSY